MTGTIRNKPTMPLAPVSLAVLAVLVSCNDSPTTAGPEDRAAISQSLFDTLPDGQEVTRYTLANDNGLTAELIDYGAILVSLTAPDRDGTLGDIVQGLDTVEDYRTRSPAFGATLGRYAGRIAGGRFTLDGETYQLDRNAGENHLSGGSVPFFKVMWAGEPFNTAQGQGVVFTHVSPDGHMGYPGQLTASVTYTLGHDDTLTIDYEATTDEVTPVNLTNHSYFNLSGDPGSPVADHVLTIKASRILATAPGNIPTGEILQVAGTPFDFTTPAMIDAQIDETDPAIAMVGGYDHYFIFDDDAGGPQAVLYHPESGRRLEMTTREPGLQLYTANWTDDSLSGKGFDYGPRTAICLEPMHYPDSPNHPAFPSTVLRPGEVYRTSTTYRLTTDRP